MTSSPHPMTSPPRPHRRFHYRAKIIIFQQEIITFQQEIITFQQEIVSCQQKTNGKIILYIENTCSGGWSRAGRCCRPPSPRDCHSAAKFIILNTIFIILNAKFIIVDEQFITFKYKPATPPSYPQHSAARYGQPPRYHPVYGRYLTRFQNRGNL